MSCLRQETSQCAVIALIKIHAENEPYTIDITQLKIALAKPVCSFHGIAGHAVLVLIQNLCGSALPNFLLSIDQHVTNLLDNYIPCFEGGVYPFFCHVRADLRCQCRPTADSKARRISTI